jgi:UDP-glucose 4-epimerase
MSFQRILRGVAAGPRIKLGNIHTKRDYVYLDDVAQYLYSCARASQSSYGVVNIGSGTEHSVEEIVRTISTLLGREITIEVDPARVRATDKLHQRADIRRLEEMAGSSSNTGWPRACVSCSSTKALLA